MKKYLHLIMVLVAALFCGCSNDGFDSGNQEYKLDGYTQKGPFIAGSAVEVRELDSNLNGTGKIFTTKISDNFGHFNIVCNSDCKFAEFVAKGYYFDEIQGDLSSGELTLRAISKIDKPTNINILTTLQAGRMRQLIGQGIGYDKALNQSEREVLKVFNIDVEDVSNFSSMNIIQQGASNSILLAISSILQCGRGVAEMSLLMEKLSSDIADNGVVDDQTWIRMVEESSKQVNSTEVVRNLEELYRKYGESVVIDDFYEFIDSDGDGVLNGGKSEYFELTFNLAFNATVRSTVSNSDVEVDRITMIGFDSEGDLLFNNTDDSPVVQDGKYKLYFKFEENYYENCTLYTIVNGSGDYDSITTIDQVEQVQSAVSDLALLSAKSVDVDFSSGRPSDDKSGLVMSFPEIDVMLQYAGVTKLEFEVECADNLEVNSITDVNILGDIYTDAYLFNDSVDGLTPILEKSVVSNSCLISSGSIIRSIFLTINGNHIYSYDFVPGDEPKLKSGCLYKYKIRLNRESIELVSSLIDKFNPDDTTTEIGFGTATPGTR